MHRLASSTMYNTGKVSGGLGKRSGVWSRVRGAHTERGASSRARARARVRGDAHVRIREAEPKARCGRPRVIARGVRERVLVLLDEYKSRRACAACTACSQLAGSSLPW
jgi:hypothetical protein